MTSDEWDKLSRDEQRIKTAELAGCLCVIEEISGGGLVPVWITPDGSRVIGKPPDYLSDLNLMHDALLLITHNGDRHQYLAKLKLVIDSRSMSDVAGSYRMHNATAAERAEAFVLTMDPVTGGTTCE